MWPSTNADSPNSAHRTNGTAATGPVWELELLQSGKPAASDPVNQWNEMTDKKLRVVVIDPLDEATCNEIARRYDFRHFPNARMKGVADAMRDADVLVCRSGVRADRDFLSGAHDLRLIVRAGVGLDNIDLGFAKARQIRIVTIPGETQQSVAELGLALIITGLRKIVSAHRSTVSGEWKKLSYIGTELRGRTVGLLGYGRTAQALQRLLAPLEIELLVSRRRSDAAAQEEVIESGASIASFDVLLERADVLVLCVPSNSSTRGLLSHGAIQKLKKQPCIVNLGRWDVMDPDALLWGLQSGLVSAAAIDPVPEGIIDVSKWDRPDVILLPHLGAQTREAQRRIGDQVLGHLGQEASLLRQGSETC